MNNKPTINSFSQLEMEELRVKLRLKKQEKDLKEHLRHLPEEVVKQGVTSIVLGVINGSVFKAGASIIQTIKSAFSSTENTGQGIFSLIKDIIKKNSETQS